MTLDEVPDVDATSRYIVDRIIYLTENLGWDSLKSNPEFISLTTSYVYNLESGAEDKYYSYAVSDLELRLNLLQLAEAYNTAMLMYYAPHLNDLRRWQDKPDFCLIRRQIPSELELSKNQPLCNLIAEREKIYIQLAALNSLVVLNTF